MGSRMNTLTPDEIKKLRSNYAKETADDLSLFEKECLSIIHDISKAKDKTTRNELKEQIAKRFFDEIQAILLTSLIIDTDSENRPILEQECFFIYAVKCKLLLGVNFSEAQEKLNSFQKVLSAKENINFLDDLQNNLLFLSKAKRNFYLVYHMATILTSHIEVITMLVLFQNEHKLHSDFFKLLQEKEIQTFKNKLQKANNASFFYRDLQELLGALEKEMLITKDTTSSNKITNKANLLFIQRMLNLCEASGISKSSLAKRAISNLSTEIVTNIKSAIQALFYK